MRLTGQGYGHSRRSGSRIAWCDHSFIRQVLDSCLLSISCMPGAAPGLGHSSEQDRQKSLPSSDMQSSRRERH